MVWSYRSNSKDQLELVSAIEVELGAVETLLCQETAYHMLDSGEVQRCQRDQGYRSEDTEKCRNILPIIVDMLFFSWLNMNSGLALCSVSMKYQFTPRLPITSYQSVSRRDDILGRICIRNIDISLKENEHNTNSWLLVLEINKLT